MHTINRIQPYFPSSAGSITHAYYDIYFMIDHFEGRPHIAEPEKCSEIKWFDIKNLPQEMIPVRRNAFNDYLNGQFYSEYFNQNGECRRY